jgi:hypothetical protein
MADPESTPADDGGSTGDDADSDATPEATATADSPAELTTEELRERVEAEYDFDDFGPEEMDEMSAEEWDAAFDPDTWITGEALLDRVEADLKHQIARRDVFARVERLADGRVIAYADNGYATISPDGSVEGFGTVLRDVKPTVALCSMDSYDVPETPEGEALPEPATVPEGSGELGNLVLQAIAGVQVLAGIGLLSAWVLISVGVIRPGGPGGSLNLIVMVVAGLAFLVVGVGLFTVVANARLSDKFRAEEYRNRLRAVGVDSGDRPDFLPVDDDQWVGEAPDSRTRERDRSSSSPEGEGRDDA